MDEVRLYDHALSAAEVAVLFNSVPEPASATLVGLASLALLGFGRKKKGSV